ncbi:hypothetical protein JCM8115_002324 [Rhodotorula mucilaginosa]
MGKRDRASHPHDAATSELLPRPPNNNNSFAEQQGKPLKEGEKASRKAARKALKAAKKRAADHDTAAAMSNPVDNDQHPAPVMDAQAMPPKKKARKAVEQAQLTEAQSSHLHQPPQPPVAGYDHSHLPVPQLHPSLAGLVPQQQQQQQPPQYQQRPAAPPPPPAPSNYQQAAAQAAANASGGAGQHRDIPVDPVLLGLLPNPPAHFTTSSVRSGGGGSEGGPAGAGGASEQNRQLQAVAAAAAVAVAVAGLARGGGGGGAPAVTDGGGSKSGSSGGKKRKDKGKEKAKADNSIEVVAAGTDQNPAVAAAAGADSTSSQKQQQQPQPSGSAQEQKESLQDLYSHVTRILGPSHKRHNNNNNNDPYTGRKVPPSHGSNGNANGTIGAEGVEKAQGGFYEQLRSKWMSTKDLRQLSEQYGATYKQGKFSLAEDTTLREAMEQFRLARGLTPADLRRLLVMKRDVRKPLAHGQSQNEIWEYLAQALGDRPLLSIYNHVKLLVAGDPIEASANANGTPQPPAAAAAEGAASAESTPGPGPGPNTDANAVASGSGSGAPKGPTPKPNFAVAPGPSLEGVLGDANRKGRWTPEEDQSLARLLKELGCSWNEIGRQLGRSGVACRDRWTKQLNNGLALGMTPKGESVPVQKAKEGKWSEAEVEQLKALHAEFGSQWKLISTKMGGTRTSTQCRTKWTDYIARREAAGLAKGEADQAASPAPPAQGPKEPASKEDWRWHASDGSRLIHTVAALNVSDPSEIDWKKIDDPRLALHGAKNLRDRFRHLVKNAKLEIQREVGSIAEVPFKDALAHLLVQHPTPDFDPTQAVSDAEKAQQRARRRAERKAAKKAEREQRAGVAQAAAVQVANLAGAGLVGVGAGPAPVAYQPQQQPQQPHLGGRPPSARASGGPEHLIGRASHLSQAYIDDSDGSDDESGDIRVDVTGRRI